MSRGSTGAPEASGNVLGYEWKVSGYSDCSLVGQRLVSPVFSSAHSDRVTRWRLTLYPRGTQWAYKDYLSLFVEYLGDAWTTVARVTLSIADAERGGAALERVMGRARFQRGALARCGDHAFVWRSFVRNAARPSLGDNAITIVCKLAFPDPTRCPVRAVESAGPQPYESFRLHKVIPASRSPVFRAMLESQSSVLEVAHVGHQAMKQVVRFVYTNRVNEIDGLAVELLVAADVYSVADLKELCENTLSNRLDVDSALQLLTLAVAHDAATLKGAAIEFIVRRSEDFFGQPYFGLSDTNVVNELLAAVAKKKAVLQASAEEF